MRMVGPNCLGVVNADPDVALNATFATTQPPSGNVAFSSQSGALGLAILEYARELGIGVSRSKPIVVVKSGRIEAGARAASSHTGSLAGMDVAVDALLGQAGVLRTDTIDELFDVAMLLASQPVPRGRRVAILTNAGGPGIMASDACESRGLEVARLSDETQRALAAFLPAEASVKNPVDMIASATGAQYQRALSVLPEAVRSLREGRFPSYAFPESAASALAKATRYGAWLFGARRRSIATRSSTRSCASHS